MKKIIGIVAIIILSLVIALNVLSLLNVSFFGFRVYKIGSGSMRPYLNVNDIIIIKKSNNYKVNDVVTYKSKGETITHRIVSIKNDEIITKGDANNTFDKPIKKNKIIGKLVFSLRGIGFINYLLSKPFIWFMIFIIGLLITIMLPDKK